MQVIQALNHVVIKEHSSPKYTPRTYYNAKSADVTLAIATNLQTAGEKCTHKAAGENYIGFNINKGSDYLPFARALYKKMKVKNAKTLNIAGNGIYTLTKYGVTQRDINLFVYKTISKVNEFHKIHKIYSGGQTGVDIAAAVVAELLGIDAEITLPLGYVQRSEDGIDTKQTKGSVVSQVIKMIQDLKEDLQTN